MHVATCKCGSFFTLIFNAIFKDVMLFTNCGIATLLYKINKILNIPTSERFSKNCHWPYGGKTSQRMSKNACFEEGLFLNTVLVNGIIPQSSQDPTKLFKNPWRSFKDFLQGNPHLCHHKTLQYFENKKQPPAGVLSNFSFMLLTSCCVFDSIMHGTVIRFLLAN